MERPNRCPHEHQRIRHLRLLPATLSAILNPRLQRHHRPEPELRRASLQNPRRRLRRRRGARAHRPHHPLRLALRPLQPNEQQPDDVRVLAGRRAAALLRPCRWQVPQSDAHRLAGGVSGILSQSALAGERGGVFGRDEHRHDRAVYQLCVADCHCGCLPQGVCERPV